MPHWMQAGLWGVATGLTLLSSTGVSVATAVANFISNIPEGLSSSVGMKKSGRSAKFVFGLWIGLAFILGAAAILGYSVFGQFSVEIQAATTALASSRAPGSLARSPFRRSGASAETPRLAR